MTKEEFVNRLASQYRHTAKFAKINAEKEIEGRRGRMDAEGFREWLRQEQRAALDAPALNTFDQVNKRWMGTPEDAANALADQIAFDCRGVVDWSEQWKKAAPIISNSTLIWPDASADWKYKTYFVQYREAQRADIRARVFSDCLEPGKPETEFFESTEAMEKALAAARHAGLINEAGKWSFTGHRTHAVSLFWIAAIAAGLAKPSAPVSKVSPFLAALFNVPLGVNAVNKKKKAEDYDLGTDDTVFQRLYNVLLTQMGK